MFHTLNYISSKYHPVVHITQLANIPMPLNPATNWQLQMPPLTLGMNGRMDAAALARSAVSARRIAMNVILGSLVSRRGRCWPKAGGGASVPSHATASSHSSLRRLSLYRAGA